MVPEIAKTREIHPALKLWGTVASALLVLGVSGTAVWVVGSISSIQNTLARMDERQIVQAPVQETRFAKIESRVDKLETENMGKTK